MPPTLTTRALAPAAPGPLGEAARAHWQLAISRLSPNALFAEATLAILNPATRALGPVFSSQLEGAILGAPLPVGQSLLLIWPQLAGLAAAVILLFTAAYVAFQRQEIRA